MYKGLILAGLTMALTATGAAAKDKAAEGAAPAPKMVCKSQQRTGTRFATKTCRSAADWDAISEQARRQAAEMTGPTISTAKGN